MIRQGVIAATMVVFVQHFGVTGYGYATACSLLSLAYIHWVVRREIVRFSYRRLWPFVAALSPIILMPFAPMPWELLMIAPLFLTFALPGPRGEVHRQAR